MLLQPRASNLGLVEFERLQVLEFFQLLQPRVRNLAVGLRGGPRVPAAGRLHFFDFAALFAFIDSRKR
jgi:hypothetical protein